MDDAVITDLRAWKASHPRRVQLLVTADTLWLLPWMCWTAWLEAVLGGRR